MRLALSCPRSGSYYVQQLLVAHGLDVGHERMKAGGLVGFPFEMIETMGSPSICGRQGALNHLTERSTHLVHVIRDPSACVTSLVAKFGASLHWFRENGFEGENQIEVMMNVWIQWNRMIQAMEPAQTVWLESIDNNAWGYYDALCAGLEIEPQHELLPFRTKEHAHPAARKRWDLYNWEEQTITLDTDEMKDRVFR